VKPEVENWRVALTWAFGSQGDVLVAQLLVGSLFDVWRHQPVEGQHWLCDAMRTRHDATPVIVRAKLELTAARIASTLGHYKALVSAADAALRLYRRLDDRLGTAEAQIWLGLGLIRSRRLVQGEGLVRAALAVGRASGAERIIAVATHALAVARYLDNDLGAARSLFRETLTIFKAAGCYRTAARQIRNLADVEFQAGNTDTALQLGREAAEGLRTSNLWDPLARALCSCSAYLTALTRFEEARGYAREALILAHEAGFDLRVAFALHHLAAIAALRAGDNRADRLVDLQRAAYVLGYANARFAELGYIREYTAQQEYDKMLPVLRNELGADLEALMKEGKHWSEDQAVAEALKIEAPDIGRPSTNSG
jgi:tetratricopeptide (TPR) repeat protein